MLVPAAIACRIASRPECWYVPSPMLANMCGRSVNGARPTHGAPSPPIWLNVRVASLVASAMVWQPMPAIAWLPSGSTVLVLCGQPAQNIGPRVMIPSTRPGASAPASIGASSPAPRRNGVSAAATSSGDSSFTAGSRDLPSIVGRCASAYSASRSCISTKDRFSSTTSSARLPAAKARRPTGSIGQASATLYTAMSG